MIYTRILRVSVLIISAVVFYSLLIQRPPVLSLLFSSAASDVYMYQLVGVQAIDVQEIGVQAIGVQGIGVQAIGVQTIGFGDTCLRSRD